MTIYVGNKHWSKAIGIEVYVGRPSVLGNPYKVGVHGNGDTVCDQYFSYFHEQVRIPISPIRVEIIRLYHLAKTNDITLMCWCKPNRCHCDTIKEFLDGQLNKK